MRWIRAFIAALTRVDAAAAGGTRRTRDLRLDFFRGLALWFIFLDHIPDNVVSWLTVRNYGFSDATEIFVFISGYTAVIAYAGIMRQGGWVRATARVLGRVWQLYVAHMMLFVVLTASVAWTAVTHSKGDTFLEHMNLTGLGQMPYETLVQAALPAVIALTNEDDYIGAMETIAREQGVGVFKRFQIMRDWVTGEHMPYAQFMVADGLHLNDFGQRCMGKLLAKAVGMTIHER